MRGGKQLTRGRRRQSTTNSQCNLEPAQPACFHILKTKGMKSKAVLGKKELVSNSGESKVEREILNILPSGSSMGS